MIPYLLASIIFGLLIYAANKLGERAAQPYVDAIEEIGKLDIPIGQKIDMMNKIYPHD